MSGGLRCFELTLPHGIGLSCRGAGEPGLPRVLWLHGFPEAAFVWDDLMLALQHEAESLAPNQRGYEASSRPPQVADYRPKHLVADLVALIRHFGAPLDLLVAHDWGGAVAWNLAAAHPQLIKRLLIINSPHPATFLRELRHSAEQQAASAYMNFLVRPDAAALLAEGDHRRLWPFLEADGAAWLDEAMRARYRAVWSAGLDGALNWYRASPLRPPAAPDDAIHTLQLPDEAVTVRVPTTVLWGERDRALRPALLEGLQHWVPQLDVQRVPGASHWIVHEQPQRVLQAVRSLLAA